MDRDESNKLIAEFMGIQTVGDDGYIIPRGLLPVAAVPEGTTIEGDKHREFFTHALHFNTSWDWLMPALEKFVDKYNSPLTLKILPSYNGVPLAEIAANFANEIKLKKQ